MRFKKHAATVLATAIAASGLLAATAQASTITIGPTDLDTAGSAFTGGIGVALNTEDANGDFITVPEKGKIKKWHGNFECSDGCGEVRLLQLRATSDPDVFTVVDQSPWTAPDDYGVDSMPASFIVEEDDVLAFEGKDSGKVYYSPAMTGGRTFTSSIPSANNFVRQSTGTGTMALYNADFVPYLDTETSLTGTPNPVTVNSALTLTAAVTATGVAGVVQTPDPTGTVAFTKGGTPIPGCSAVVLVDGEASCPTTASPYSTNSSYEAAYSGDTEYNGSNSTTNVRVRDVSTTVASVTPNPVARHMPITYVAEITGLAPVGGEVWPAEQNRGTVAFFVDGEPVADCATRTVSNQYVALCETLSPLVGGTHTLKADYSGGTALTPSSGSTEFVVLAPAVKLPETTDFGSLTVGEVSANTVILTNSGAANLTVEAASIKDSDAFTITADACTGVTLMPGSGCSVDVAFRPGAAGPLAGTLVFSDDAPGGTHSTALTGTGVAVPAPPVPPAPTPTPPTAAPTPTPAPQPGATLAPGAKPTLTVTGPTASNPNATPTVSVPLSCPANEECQLDGTLKINTSALSKSARAAAAETTTVARFSKVQIARGKLKTVKLKLSPAFIKSAQKRGIRSIKATLTINTVLGSGQRMTTQQLVTVLIPKAVKRKPAAPKAQPKFTG